MISSAVHITMVIDACNLHAFKTISISGHPQESMNATQSATPLRTIVVSTPGVMRESLWALLESFPQIEIIGSAAGCLTALNLTKTLSPDLIVIDANHAESEVQSLLQSLQSCQSVPYSILFANTSNQKIRMQKTGADTVLLRSGPSKQLTETLKRFFTAKQAIA